MSDRHDSLPRAAVSPLFEAFLQQRSSSSSRPAPAVESVALDPVVEAVVNLPEADLEQPPTRLERAVRAVEVPQLEPTVEPTIPRPPRVGVEQQSVTEAPIVVESLTEGFIHLAQESYGYCLGVWHKWRRPRTTE